MTATITAPTVSPEEFLEMDDAGLELCDGVLKERSVSRQSSTTAARISHELLGFLEAHSLGEVYGQDMGLQIFPDRPRRIPRADLVFVSNARLASVGDADFGYLTIPPDLLVEVVSRWNTALDIEGKVEEYPGAGVRMVWVIYPDLRKARVHRADGSVADVPPGGSLDGEDVVPGFSCPLERILPPRRAAPASTA